MSVVTLAKVKAAGNFQSTDNDAQLQAVLDQAEAEVIKACGPLSATPITERVKLTGKRLVLNTLPVISITSVTVTETGATLTIEADDTDLTSGVIELEYPTEDVYTVVYSAGRAAVPADLERAVIEMTRYLWRPYRGAGQRQGASDDSMAALRMAEYLMTDYRLPV